MSVSALLSDTFTSTSINTSILINKFLGISSLGPYLPLGMTHPCPSIHHKYKPISRDFFLRTISDLWDDTPTSINASNIIQTFQEVIPLGMSMPLNITHTIP